jgi:hypothetical protein
MRLVTSVNLVTVMHLKIAGLCNDASASIDMAIPQKMGVPDQIPHQGKNKFDEGTK